MAFELPTGGRLGYSRKIVPCCMSTFTFLLIELSEGAVSRGTEDPARVQQGHRSLHAGQWVFPGLGDIGIKESFESFLDKTACRRKIAQS